MKKLGIAVGVAACMVFGTAGAKAATLSFDGAGWGQSVSVSSPTWNGFAGQIKMTETSATPAESFIAWCLDLTDYVSTGTFTEKFVGDSSIFDAGEVISTAKQEDIQKYFDVNYDSVLTTIATAVNSVKKATAAAFQVGLWEIVYETSGSYKTNLGSFADTSAVSSTAQDFLDNIADWTQKNFTLSFWDAEETNQDLVSAAPYSGIVPDVPIPAAAWLLGSGLIGLAGIGRLKKARKATA
ncbi:MAG: hypothetical protein CL534_03155 [Ahrensia sp.]|nr:hypothetical protein [Ahrensia sp.]